MPTTYAENIVRLVNKGLAVIIGLVSNFVFGIININPNKLETALIVILTFILWVIVDPYIRDWLDNLRVLKSNKTWKEVLILIMDFAFLLGIFLVLQLLLEFLRNSIINSNPSFFEVLIGIYAIMLIAFSIVQTAKSLA